MNLFKAAVKGYALFLTFIFLMVLGLIVFMHGLIALF